MSPGRRSPRGGPSPPSPRRAASRRLWCPSLRWSLSLRIPSWSPSGGGGEHETSTSKSTSRAFFSSFHLHRLHFTPLVPLAAMAGSLSDYEGSAEMRDCELIMSPVKDVTMAVPVSGDSMSPEFPNGSVVLVKRINERAGNDLELQLLRPLTQKSISLSTWR